jgi:hypothetical protein
MHLWQKKMTVVRIYETWNEYDQVAHGTSIVDRRVDICTVRFDLIAGGVTDRGVEGEVELPLRIR